MWQGLVYCSTGAHSTSSKRNKRIKMIKPLEPYRQCLIWLCVHPADKSANNCKKITCVAFFVANSTFQLCNFIGCLTFCWKFHSIDLRKCLFAFLMTSADFGCIYVVMITITTMRHRIAAIFEDLSTIYDTRKSILCWLYELKWRLMC